MILDKRLAGDRSHGVRNPDGQASGFGKVLQIGRQQLVPAGISACVFNPHAYPYDL